MFETDHREVVQGTDAMTSEHPDSHGADRADSVEMPEPTIWPMVLSLGLVLIAAGVATNLTLAAIGGLLLFIGLGGWISQMLPGKGHMHEPRVAPELRPRPPVSLAGTVSHLGTGMPGYRLRLPIDMHPVSAGVKGGIIGGLLMPIPALGYGVVSDHGMWYPVNLLAGMVLPLSADRDLTKFDLGLFLLALVIHATMCLVIGLLYGVLMPTLPDIPKPMAWGGLLMPLLWTGVSYSLMAVVNPIMKNGVDWPWFIVSQFLFGIVAAVVVMSLRRVPPIPAGITGGLIGGVVMAAPALLWARATGHGIWYPVNLLAGMVMKMDGVTDAELGQFHSNWFITAIAIHGIMSVAFGLVYGSLLARVPPIPGPMAWGGLLMPLLWTGVSYSLMGVVNPLLAKEVDWRWFIVSQFIFGIAAAIVVVNSEKVYIPPAGRGLPPEPVPQGGATS
jgi:hypothetical protein